MMLWYNITTIKALVVVFIPNNCSHPLIPILYDLLYGTRVYNFCGQSVTKYLSGNAYWQLFSFLGCIWRGRKVGHIHGHSSVIRKCCLLYFPLSAVHRTLIDASRTIIVWVTELAMLYCGLEGYGEPWTKYSPIQVLRVTLLLSRIYMKSIATYA